MKLPKPLLLVGVVGFAFAAGAASAAPIVRSAVTTAGAGDVAFNAVINTFRADLGGVLNPPGACSPSPCTSGRREINWDAVPAGASSPNAFPGNFFNGTAGIQPAGRQRGITFTTPGSGFRVSATEFSDETVFGPAEFDAFSPARLFASMGSPITDSTFSVPGSPSTIAFVNGFGVVFSDVDYTGSAKIEYFDINDNSLGTFDVPGVFPTANGQNSQGSFSFLGVSFDAGERVGRIRITSGTHGIDGNFVGLDDAVVMDDFIFGEPIRVPLPSTALLLAVGVLSLVAARRRVAVP
jgi:hypothetical protein